jgi:hypothetical protein
MLTVLKWSALVLTEAAVVAAFSAYQFLTISHLPF